MPRLAGKTEAAGLRRGPAVRWSAPSGRPSGAEPPRGALRDGRPPACCPELTSGALHSPSRTWGISVLMNIHTKI